MKKQKLVSATIAAFFAAGLLMAADHEVTQREKRFSVEELLIREGDTIVFKNDDTVVHNLFSKEFDFNVTQDPGEETKVRFDASGKTVVRCVIHPKMKLNVRVVE